MRWILKYMHLGLRSFLWQPENNTCRYRMKSVYSLEVMKHFIDTYVNFTLDEVIKVSTNFARNIMKL